MRYQDRKPSFTRPSSKKLFDDSTQTLRIFGLSILSSAMLTVSVYADSGSTEYTAQQVDSSQPRLLAALSVDKPTGLADFRNGLPDARQTSTPTWFSRSQLSESGSRLWNAVRNAKLLGIDPERLHHTALNEILGSGTKFDARQKLEVEHLLDSSFKFLITEVTAGRVSPKESQRYWFEEVETPDTEQLLELAKSSPGALGNILADIVHNNRNIEPLLDKISEYQVIEAAGGWPQLSEGPTIEPGDTSPRVSTLRMRLVVSGDLETRFANGPMERTRKHILMSYSKLSKDSRHVTVC